MPVKMVILLFVPNLRVAFSVIKAFTSF